MTAFRDSRFNDAVCHMQLETLFLLPLASFLPRISSIKPPSSFVPQIKNERGGEKKEKRQDRVEEKSVCFMTWDQAPEQHSTCG